MGKKKCGKTPNWYHKLVADAMNSFIDSMCDYPDNVSMEIGGLFDKPLRVVSYVNGIEFELKGRFKKTDAK